MRITASFHFPLGDPTEEAIDSLTSYLVRVPETGFRFDYENGKLKLFFKNIQEKQIGRIIKRSPIKLKYDRIEVHADLKYLEIFRKNIFADGVLSEHR